MPAAAYRQSAAHLGQDVPDDPDILRDVLEADTAHLYRLGAAGDDPMHLGQWSVTPCPTEQCGPFP